MKFSRPVVINTVLIAVIVIIAASVLIIFNPFGAKNASATTQLTGTVEEGVVSTTITASGNIAPVEEVDASFGASGTIATVKVALGQTVTAGEVLGTLQTADLQTAVTNAETDLYHDQIILDDDYTSLSSAKSSPNGNVEQAQEQVYSQESTVANAQTSVTSAEEALADATLKAPIAGLVIAVNDQVGDTVSGTNSSSSDDSSGSGGTGGTGGSSSSGSSSDASSSSGSSSAFVTIADTAKFTVTADIAEADISDVAVGQTATVTFPAISSTSSSSATVTAIAPTGTTSNSIVTYATTITLTNPPAGLRIGQTADVTITTKASKATALYVPAAAITTSDGTSTVKVVKNGKTSAVPVTLGIVGDNGTQITSGLTRGETIVIGNVSATTTTTGTGTTGTGTTGTGTTGGGFGGGGFGGGGGGRNFGGGGNG